MPVVVGVLSDKGTMLWNIFRLTLHDLFKAWIDHRTRKIGDCRLEFVGLIEKAMPQGIEPSKGTIEICQGNLEKGHEQHQRQGRIYKGCRLAPNRENAAALTQIGS